MNREAEDLNIVMQLELLTALELLALIQGWGYAQRKQREAPQRLSPADAFMSHVNNYVTP